MRKLTLIISLLSIVVFPALSQSIELSYNGNTIPNGSTICLFDTSTDISYAVNGITVKNISNQNYNYKVRKIELQIVSGSDNSFCWGGLCEPTNVFISSMYSTINAGSSNSDFIADYSSHNNCGKTRVMYVFYNTTLSTDTTSVILEYLTCSGVGITKNLNKQSIISNAFPNPTKSMFKVNYNLSNYTNARFELHNIVGTKVKEIEITDFNGTLKVDVSDILEGVYFYSLVIDDKILTSKRIVIQK